MKDWTLPGLLDRFCSEADSRAWLEAARWPNTDLGAWQREALYSSQECSACGYVDARNRDGERFRCLWCERRIHADVNAARIIGRRRSPCLGSGVPITKAGVLQEVVRHFLERHPWLRQGRSGLEGKSVDPRWTNPYFKEWCASVTSMLPTSAAPLHGATRQ